MMGLGRGQKTAEARVSGIVVALSLGQLMTCCRAVAATGILSPVLRDLASKGRP
jgi:hypothetical protein